MNRRSSLYRFASDALRLAANPRFLAPCIAGAFMLVVGTILGVQYSFNMAAVLFVLPVASYLLTVLSLRGLRVRRAEVPTAVEGKSVEFAVTVEVAGMAPRLSLKVTDTLPSAVESEDAAGIEVAVCSPGALKLRYTVRPLRRGVYTIGPIYLAGKDPVGIFEYRKNVGQRTELVVYPRPQPVPLGAFLGGAGLQSENAEPTGKKGPGLELHGVRDYAPGDELKRIHWRTTARRGSLVVTEFEQGLARNVIIAIELLKGADFPGSDGTSLDVAARVAAYVADSALTLGLPVRLLLASGKEISSYSAAAKEDAEQLLYPLARAKADSEMSLAQVLAAGNAAGEDIVVLITPILDEHLAQEILHLSVRGARVNVFMVPGTKPPPERIVQLLESTGVGVTFVEKEAGDV